MINLELDVDDLFINNHTMKTADFFSNAVLSITKVINHFNCFEKAFEGLTADELMKIEENTIYNEDVFKPSVNKADSILYKHKHKFSLNLFLTDHIVHPFTSILKDYCSRTYCKIFLTRNGMLRAVRFIAEVESVDHKSFGVTYNEFFEIDSISRMYLVKKCYSRIKSQIKSYCDKEEDEKYFIDLFLKGAETKLVDYLPEYSIPSAYDFTTDEFYIRLKVAEMMLV